MRICSVCRTKYFKGNGTLFHVPKDEKTRRKWSEICGIKLTSSARICKDHFLASSIVFVGARASLLPNAEPFIEHLPQPQSMISEAHMFLENESWPQNLYQNPYFLMSPQGARTHEEGTQTEIYKKDGETQTDETYLLIEYVKRIRTLEAENLELKSQLLEANKAVNAMRVLFTEGQIRKIMKPGRIQWRWKDISSAICLHAAGPRALLLPCGA